MMIGGACYVGVDSLLDLGRLSCALERVPLPLFAFKHGRATRIAAQADLFMGPQYSTSSTTTVAWTSSWPTDSPGMGRRRSIW